MTPAALVVCATAFVPPSARWLAPSSKLTKGPPVSGAGAARIGDAVYVFGGLDPARAVTNALWRFTEGAGWEELQGKGSEEDGTRPRERMYTTAVAVGGELLVCGGWDPGAKGSGGTFLDDAWALSVAGGKPAWRRVGSLPGGPVSRHVTCALDKTTAVLHSYRCDDHVLVYDSKRGELRKQRTEGAGPERVGMHAAAVLDGPTLVVYGGGDKDTSTGFANDAWALECDGKVWRWSKLHVRAGGARPPALGSACAAAVDGRSLVLFGGAEMRGEYEGGKGLVARAEAWALKLGGGGEAHWTRLCPDELSDDSAVQTSAEAPGPRVAATLTPLRSRGDEPRRLLLHGGWRPSDMHTYPEGQILVVSE